MNRKKEEGKVVSVSTTKKISPIEKYYKQKNNNIL